MMQTLRVSFWNAWYSSHIVRFAKWVGKFTRACMFALRPPKSASHLPRFVRFHITMDYNFAVQQAELETVRVRNELRHQNIGPTDPRYPDVSGMLESWGQDMGLNIQRTLTMLARVT